MVRRIHVQPDDVSHLLSGSAYMFDLRQAPVAAADFAMTEEDVPVGVDVLSNDLSVAKLSWRPSIP